MHALYCYRSGNKQQVCVSGISQLNMLERATAAEAAAARVAEAVAAAVGAAATGAAAEES